MRYRNVIILFIGILTACYSNPVFARRVRKSYTHPVYSTGARNAYEVKTMSRGAFKRDDNFYYKGAKNRGNGLMGSGGMNYKYNQWTGLYHDLRSMRKNLYGVYGDISYSGMLNNVPMAATILPGGYSGTLGFCYEYDHYGKVIFQTGIGIRWQSVGNNVDKVITEKDHVKDYQGYDYKLIYDFYDRCDYSDIIYAQIPLLVGSYWGGLYYMAGFKIQLPLWGRTRVKLRGSTVGVYEQYIGLGPGDIFQEMDNHGLRLDVPEKRQGQGIAGLYANDFFEKKWDILVSAEIGWEWAVRDDRTNTGFGHPKIYDTRLRIALFADYGLLNQNQHTSLPLYYIPDNYKWDFPMYEFNHIFSTKQTATDKRINNLFVGIKFTALIGVPREQGCVLCGPFKSEREFW